MLGQQLIIALQQKLALSLLPVLEGKNPQAMALPGLKHGELAHERALSIKEIAEAYAVLSDPNKRADYDSQGFSGVAGLSPEDLFGGIDFEDLFSGLGFDFGLGSPFGGAYGDCQWRG